MNGFDDRRRDDRRRDHVSLAEYPVPEFRKALLTATLLFGILILFLYMVRGVLVAVVAGIVVGAYLIPLDNWLQRRIRSASATAVLTIVLFAVPLVAILVYSWIEISDAAQYLNEHREEVLSGLNMGLHRIPYAENINLDDRLPALVERAASSSTQIAEELREAVDTLLISIAVFLFTTFYVLTEHDRILKYLRARIPGRYRGLADPVSNNIRAVIYGVLYGTFLTQLVKSGIILTMNVLFDVPLAIVLAIASFFIGLLPIVGSWTVYTPVALYLMVWRGDVVAGAVMLAIGFFVNTLFISTYLRPKIAAEKSEVLNFYWMFIALVTGVYTFGLMGIIIGPVLISVLKAIFDAISGEPGQASVAALTAEPGEKTRASSG
ncbi:MAG: AI-2E family transporter [Longimicrobiales bacterium]